MIFQDLAKIFTKQTFIKILNNIFSDTIVQKSIIDIIQNRIFSKGVDVDGRQLRTDATELKAGNKSKFYHDFTVAIKSDKGQRTQNVTLKDTGEFYNSWYVKIENEFFNIQANFKDIFNNFELSYNIQDEFEEKITSLNNDELSFILKSRILPKFEFELKRMFNGMSI